MSVDTFRRRVGLLMATLGLAALACSAPSHGAAAPEAAEESAQEFIARVNQEMAVLRLETATASWVQATYITPDTSFLAARASEKALVFTSRAIAESARYLGQELDPDTARQLMLLRFGAAMPAPDDPDKRAELAEISTEMEAMYGSARYCPASGECVAETDIIRLMADERKYKKTNGI